MTTSEVRAIYDSMAAALPDAVRPFTVVVDDVQTFDATGIQTNSTTMRHLFAGGAMGNRCTAQLICRSDAFKDQNGATIPAAGLDQILDGLLLTIGSNVYRVMQAGTSADGGLLRLALDSPEAVGL